MGLSEDGPLDRLGGVGGVIDSLANGVDLRTDDAELVMDHVFDGDVNEVQVAGLLVALRAKGETADELTGMVRSMLNHATSVEVPFDAMDVVGTGGDGKHTVNISTMTALVVAGAGVPVCKHGNRAASSSVGTADVFEALGVRIELTPAEVVASVEEAGIGFCFAQAFHPAMRFVGPVRAALGVRTAFNLLGPLANPSRPRHMLVGISDPSVAEKMASVLGANGVERAWVVHADDGYDELTTTAGSEIVEVRATGDGEYSLSRWHLDPRSLGFDLADPAALLGGDAARNAQIIRSVLAGERGAVRDIVILNAAAALVIAGATDDLDAGVTQAEASIDGGQAAEALEKMIGSTTRAS